jgi:hypothetical protein
MILTAIITGVWTSMSLMLSITVRCLAWFFTTLALIL